MNYITLINIILSVLNIVSIAYKFWNERPRLEFYDVDTYKSNLFIKYKGGEFRDFDGANVTYTDSKGIVFYHVKIANPSYRPCTISHCILNVEGFPKSFYRCSTKLTGDYIFPTGNHSNIYIFDKEILKLPCTVPALGYVEGFFVFPYNELYPKKKFFAEITVKTPRKEFTTGGFIRHVETI